MSRFYGFTYEYIENLDIQTLQMYYLGMDRVKYREILDSMTVSDYPKLTKEGRKDLHRSVYKRAYPETFNNPKNVVKFSDLSRKLNG